MSNKTMKLTYFDGRGRAEIIRYILKLAGKDFEDCRVKQDEWPEVKKTTPLGEVPVFKHGDCTLVQSMAIARYVAREFGLCGVNSWEQAVCDMMCDTGSDVINAGVKVFMAKSEEDKNAAKEKAKDAVAGFEKLVSMYKKGNFILGAKPSLADAAVESTVDMAKQFVPDLLENYPNLAAVCKSFTAVPAIAAWIKSRPETPY